MSYLWNHEIEKLVIESNLIEGINRKPLSEEIKAFGSFVDSEELTVSTMCQYVKAIEPLVSIRTRPGHNVRIGSHSPPAGGPHIATRLQQLLDSIVDGNYTPWEAHIVYETLHPFGDGNGRSGRALWAWQMVRGHDMYVRLFKSLGFLHTFYYQTLSESEVR